MLELPTLIATFLLLPATIIAFTFASVLQMKKSKPNRVYIVVFPILSIGMTALFIYNLVLTFSTTMS